MPVKTKTVNLARIEALDPDKRLTRDQAAELVGCSAGTLANHNYAGLLPYAPTRPITIRAGDLKVYAKMILNGYRPQLHFGLRIRSEDMPTYSRLDGVFRLDRGHPATRINEVVKLTGRLYARYKKEG